MINRRSLLIQAGLLAAGAGAAIVLRDRVLWPPPVISFAGARSATPWLPFAGHNAEPLATLTASIAGRPLRALIDTGAQISVIDRGFIDAHGLGGRLGAPMVAYGVGGGMQVARGLRLDVQVGDMTLHGLNAAIVDLGPIAGRGGLSTALILGQDVLWRLIADIDFPARRAAFSQPAAYVRPAGAAAAPVRRAGHALMATVRLEDRPVEVEIDTGATGLLALTRGAAHAAGLLDGRPQRAASSIVLGGRNESAVLTVRSLDFAGRTWRDVDARIFAAPPAPGFPKGLLGVDALRDSRAILDLGAGRLDLVDGHNGRPASGKSGQAGGPDLDDEAQ